MSLLQLVNVSRHFGPIKAVDGISLDVQQGQFVTLLGPSGCGKTTTLRLIAGFEKPDTGTIRFRGSVFADQYTFVEPKDRRIGMVFQDYALFPHLNVAQNVGFGVQLSRGAKTARVDELLALVGLEGFEERMPFELSGGQQQRVALARALAPAPDLLLLDEPFSSLDAALRVQLRSEMRSILRQTHTTCIFVTHAQDEALSLSDSVAVIIDGKLAQVASPEILYEQPATLEVATFVGEANLISGDAYGDYAETILGNIPLLKPAFGPVKLMVRPESIEFESTDREIETPAQVCWQEYYGHERRIGLSLADGTPITARVPAAQPITSQAIGVRVRGAAVAYPVK
jgi:iron(III) transport system ATP-binding protein